MAAELSLPSLTHHQKLAQIQKNQSLNPSLSSISGFWMWNHNQTVEEDDGSWEVKAFEEDTNHAMGTTWPPRSYTCTFCRREFKSAQALGGHMNVHRRDRAKLNQPPLGTGSTSSSSSSTLLIPTQEFMANGKGLCYLYSLPSPTPNGVLTSPSNLLSISPNPMNNLQPSVNFPLASPSINSSMCHPINSEPCESNNDNSKNNNGFAIEELDLELRLGRRP